MNKLSLKKKKTKQKQKSLQQNKKVKSPSDYSQGRNVLAAVLAMIVMGVSW